MTTHSVTVPAAIDEPPRVSNVPVGVEFGVPLAGWAEKTKHEALESAVESDLAVLSGRLGIDGSPVVSVSTVDSRRPLRVSVHGRLQPYPPALLRRAWLATAPPDLQALPDTADLSAEDGYPSGWLRDLSLTTEPTRRCLFAFAVSLVRAVISEHPSCLLGPEQIIQYAGAVGAKPEYLAPVLRGLLDLGVPVSDRHTIMDVLKEGVELGRTPDDTIEAAFARLRAHVVELLVHPSTLEELLGARPDRSSVSVYSAHVDGSLQKPFRDLEAHFFQNYGFLLPRFDWVATDTMRQGMLSVRHGVWTSLPLPLVRRGERLMVSSDIGKLEQGELNSVGRPTLHPLYGTPCRIVVGDKQTFADQGVTTGGPVDFVCLALFSELSNRAGQLLGMEEIEYQLARLRYTLEARPSEQVVLGPYPDLVHTTLTLYTLGDLTRLLRAFVGEGLSVRNLREILDCLVNYDTVPLEPGFVLVDDRVAAPRADTGAGGRSASYYEFCRKGLTSQLTARYSSATEVVGAYVLDPEVEKRSRTIAAEIGSSGPHRAEAESKAELLRDAVWARVLETAPAPVGQVVVTDFETRASVRALLEPELPDLHVVARSELAPDARIETIARIVV